MVGKSDFPCPTWNGGDLKGKVFSPKINQSFWQASYPPNQQILPNLDATIVWSRSNAIRASPFLPEKGLIAIPVPKSRHFRQKNLGTFLINEKMEAFLAIGPFLTKKTHHINFYCSQISRDFWCFYYTLKLDSSYFAKGIKLVKTFFCY